MTSVNIRQLRDTRQLKAWLKAGETVELRDRNEVIGEILPKSEANNHRSVQWPDFAARRKAIFGGRVIPAVETLLEERANSLY
jgi:antitoxin (DNA-binding transcriptional repressor) of toxin-antitoxin stability system